MFRLPYLFLSFSYSTGVERTPLVQPPHQLKVFEGDRGRFGGGKRGLSPESPLFPSPIFPPRTKEQRPGGGDGALQRKEEDTVSVRRRMTLPLNEQTQLGTCETVRWNRSFKVVEALVYVNGFADYCFP